MSLTIKKLFRFKTLQLHTPLLTEIMKHQPIELKHPTIDKNGLIGIEVEVENLHKFPQFSAFWSVTEDGSLRNDGREYISWPLRSNQIEYGLRLLFNALAPMKYEFTPRCSIHIHMNARTMTADHVRGLIYTYLVFEKSLFAFVGENRANNIHCVPLYDSNLTHLFDNILSGNEHVNKWMKYTALNICPLADKGTIEFRHMHGTDNIDKIMTWINILSCLKIYAYKHTLEEILQTIQQLNTNSQYRQFAHLVFGDFAHYIFPDSYTKDACQFMEDGVKLVKYCLEVEKQRSYFRTKPFTNKRFSQYVLSKQILSTSTTKDTMAFLDTPGWDSSHFNEMPAPTLINTIIGG